MHQERAGDGNALSRATDDTRERRLGSLIGRLPDRLQSAVHWLRKPSARWVRIPAGILLTAGGLLSFLPVLGFWMLPLGLLLLAEDVPALRRATDRVLDWVERRRPHWFSSPLSAHHIPRKEIR